MRWVFVTRPRLLARGDFPFLELTNRGTGCDPGPAWLALGRFLTHDLQAGDRSVAEVVVDMDDVVEARTLHYRGHRGGAVTRAAVDVDIHVTWEFAESVEHLVEGDEGRALHVAGLPLQDLPGIDDHGLGVGFPLLGHFVEVDPADVRRRLAVRHPKVRAAHGLPGRAVDPNTNQLALGS